LVNTIEETVKFAGWGRRKAMQKQIDLFKNQLLTEENLLGVAASQPNPTEQIYVTDKRVIVHKIEGLTKNSRVEIPLKSISSINTNVQGFKGATIEVIASNNKATVEKIPVHVANEIKSLLDSLIL
jgi:hypothetical protein